MMDISLLSTILVFVNTLLLLWLASTVYNRLQSPPGPFPLPLIGNLLTLNKAGTETLNIFTRLAKEYGDIFILRLGTGIKMLFINDYRLLQQAYVKQAADFAHRPADNLPFLNLIQNKVGAGVLLTNGKAWQELRRVSLTAMREMGVGKKSLEERVMEETTVILEKLSDLKEQPYYMKPILAKCASNIICNVIFGSRFEHDDERFIKLLDNIEKTFRINPFFQPMNFFPILQHFPPFVKMADTFIETIQESDNYVKELMVDHEETFDSDNIRDFVDLLIDLRKKDKSFTESMMRRTIVDLFSAGSDTTSTGIYWALLFVAAHTDVQKKCHEEIDRVVGKSRQVTLADKSELSYTEATIMESLRMGVITALGIPHMATRDTTLKGLHIQKGTVVVANMMVMNKDPQRFPDPDKFNPERWLDDKGKVTHRENLMSFSVGPRSCLGEVLAKMELNLIFPSILQFYSVCPVSDDQPIDLEYSFGLTVQGKKQDLVFKKR